MRPYRKLEIRFLREDKSSVDDDRLEVTKIGDSTVRVQYTERIYGTNVSEFVILNYNQFLNYIYRLLNLLTLDDDPIHSVQFMIPSYPSILVLVTNIPTKMNIILEWLGNVCTCWPRSVKNRPVITILPRSPVSDQEEDEDEVD